MNKIFDDMMKMAGGAMNTADAFRHEAEGWMKQKAEECFRNMNLVTREEFDVVQATVTALREEQEALKQEIAALKAGGKG
jgi:BMFP domain-containing protein YqiC